MISNAPIALYNFISDEDTGSLVSFINTQNKQNSLNIFECDNRRYVWNSEDPQFVQLIKKYSKKFVDQTKQKVYPHIVGAVMYEPGSFVKVHHDRAEALHCQKCIFGAVIYLNDDFDGGETYFPILEFEYKPIKGSLLHYSIETKDSEHGGNIVTNGIKYVIPICFTMDKKLANPLYITEE